MNTRGKEQIARTIIQTMKVMLSEKKNDPIITKDREDQEINSEETEKIVTDTQNEDKKAQTTQEEQVGRDKNQKDEKLPSKRARKPPTTRREDFLWLDKNMKN